MPVQDQNERLRTLLQDVGLRPTRQRSALAALLFDGIHKHVTAEQIHAALKRKKARVSMATVYNALHQFTDAGLLSEVTVNAERTYFDTHTAPHHHFFDETDGSLHDIMAKDVRITRMPKTPRGRKVKHVEVVVHLCAPSSRKN